MRFAWRLRAVFAEKGFVIKSLQWVKTTNNASWNIRKRVYIFSNQLIKTAQPGKVVPPLIALGWLGASRPQETSASSDSTNKMSELESDMKTADELYDNNETQKAHDLLCKHKDSQNAEVEWRLARACRVLAEKSKDSEKKKALTYETLDHAKLALSLDDKNFACHKWYAIALSNVGDYEGTKAKLQNAYTMKEHFEKAIELNPTDPTSRHLLGVWCFTFADMGWVTRKLAATLFASPPSSSYDEALGHFQKAEELEPNFYSQNHLLLGKTLLRQNKKEEAKKWLDKAANSNPCKTVDDESAKKEAEELLRKNF